MKNLIIITLLLSVIQLVKSQDETPHEIESGDGGTSSSMPTTSRTTIQPNVGNRLKNTIGESYERFEFPHLDSFPLLKQPLNLTRLAKVEEYFHMIKHTNQGYLCEHFELRNALSLKSVLNLCWEQWQNINELIQITPKNLRNIDGYIYQQLHSNNTIKKNNELCSEMGGFPFAIPFQKNIGFIEKLLDRFSKTHMIIHITKINDNWMFYQNGKQVEYEFTNIMHPSMVTSFLAFPGMTRMSVHKAKPMDETAILTGTTINSVVIHPLQLCFLKLLLNLGKTSF
jgi:hypothetical protein